MFISHNQVRMHDSDMAGILYFPRQFRFAHDALEDFIGSFGYTLDQIFRHEHFIFVIVHAESDYLSTLRVGDKLEIHLTIAKLGNTSFTVRYEIYKLDKTHVGTVKTVHVTLDSVNRKKIPIPDHFRALLEPYCDIY